MAQQMVLLCLAIVAALAGQSAAVNLIELTDANQAVLNLELSKALGGVQAAYKESFRFDTVEKIRRFMLYCEILHDKMAKADDSAYQGLAKQIKEIMSESSIKRACSVTSEQLPENLDQLDDLSSHGTVYAPLSGNVFNLLASLHEMTKADANLNTLAGHLIRAKTSETAETLLRSVPKDVEMIIGEVKPKKGLLDLDIHYKKFCEISLIKPICKLVRGTHLDVPAIAADVEKFAKALKAGAPEVTENRENSGVSLEELKANCQKLRRHLRPVDQINKYLSAGLLDAERLADQRKIQPELDNYVALHDLCQQVTES